MTPQSWFDWRPATRKPFNGAGVFAALEANKGCGLLDRLIADDYGRAELIAVTLDRKMGALPKVRRL